MTDTLTQRLREELDRPHAVCDDYFYSCPKAPRRADDDRPDDDCTCGKDARDDLLRAVLREKALEATRERPRQELRDEIIIIALRAEISCLTQRLEQERVRLAAASSAALGYAEDCKPGDYGYSASLYNCRRTYHMLLTERTIRARLEAALRGIVACRCTYAKDPLEHARNAVAHCQSLARAALAPPGEETPEPDADPT